MELTEAHYDRMAPVLPVPRDNVRVSNRHVPNTIQDVAEPGCKWRGVPPWFGRWHPLYPRMKRQSKNGVLNQGFEHLQKQRRVQIKLEEAVSLDSTIERVHPDGPGVRRKTVRRLSASPAGDGSPRVIGVPRLRARQ